MNWVIGDWTIEGETVRAPAYRGNNGVWWRAGESDYGGPTMLRMEDGPTNVYALGAIAERLGAGENFDMQGMLMRMEIRQAALADRIDRLYHEMICGLQKIERAGRPNALATSYTPQDYSSPHYSGPLAPTVYMGEAMTGPRPYGSTTTG